MTIETFGKWADVRRAAASQRRTAGASMPGEQLPHGLAPQQIEAMRDRFETFLPQATGKVGTQSQANAFFEGLLPAGANLAPGAGRGYAESFHRRQANLPYGGQLSGGGGNGVYQTSQRPYQPEFDSPDRQNYPVHRNLANIYFRMFYKLDPIVGTGTDMISEMIWSPFTLTGEGVDGEIRDTCEEMVDETRLLAKLPHMSREFDVIGEVIPHCFYDDSRGMWTHIALHNPDQVEVIYSPFLKMEPIIEFRPEQKLRQILTSNNPLVQPVRDSMPDEILSALTTGQNIPLSPINTTFIPRKLHDYEVRGTSVLSRMWRMFMYEDSLFNASIAIARRAAGPLKVAKLGDRNTGWIPDPTQEQRLLELLVASEADPAAWLVYHYGIEFDLVGSQERAWKIEQSSEFIERQKLIALGISKAFLWGEVTYASAQSGLTVFLQRLRAKRDFFEATWLYPKFFRPVAVMNRWIKPTQAELSHGVRTRRSQRELVENNRYIVPTIEWDRPLDPSVDSAMIAAVQQLEGIGVKFSKTTKMSLVNRNYETELQQQITETKMEQDLMAQHPELRMQLGGGGGAEGGGGGFGGGGPVLPGLPPEALGLDEGGEMPPPPEGGKMPPPEMGAPPAAAAGDNEPHGGTQLWDDRGFHGAWAKSDALDLIGLFQGEHAEEDPWREMVSDWGARAAGGDAYARAALTAMRIDDAVELWDHVGDWLLSRGYPSKDVRDLEAILQHEGILAPRVTTAEVRRTNELVDSTDDWVGASLPSVRR